jgi:hypothetical protein
MKMKTVSEDIEIKICQDYQNLMTKQNIYIKYNIRRKLLQRILSKYNIKTNEQKLYLTGRKKKSMYDYWIIKHGKEEADIRMKSYSEKRSKLHSGKNNPMYGKPSPNGSGQGWKGWYKDFYFRSLRELSYVIYLDENNIKWSTAEKKKFRIEYKDYNGTDRTYAPDFIIEDKKLVEIKPKKLHDSISVKMKSMAAIEFCNKNGLTYEIIDFPINSEKIKIALDSGIVVFNCDYKERFLKFISK